MGEMVVSTGGIKAVKANQILGLLRRQSIHQFISNGMVYILLTIYAFSTMLPLLYMISTSLKAFGQEFAFPIQWIPKPPVWRNYVDALTAVPSHVFLRNTLVVVGACLIGELMTSSLAAYGFARLRFPGRNALFLLCISSMMLPYVVTMIPVFILFRYLGWINTLYALTVPSFFGGHPFFVFLLRQFFLTLPVELDDAAKIDGAGHFRIWWSILMPLAKPGLATVAIISFIFHWNDFMGPLIYLNTNDKLTLALGMRLFRNQYYSYFNLIMAYSVMMTLPVFSVFFMFQKYFVRGISMTGLAGR